MDEETDDEEADEEADEEDDDDEEAEVAAHKKRLRTERAFECDMGFSWSRSMRRFSRRLRASGEEVVRLNNGQYDGPMVTFESDEHNYVERISGMRCVRQRLGLDYQFYPRM